ncbi:transposable element Tc3 transposase [Trichonephila clavipes]|nr:transposable element Tc3 transposase [Trichonephila clavipes]
MSDEAHFWLNGYVNKQNCRIWSEANPQVYVETPLHPEKLTVWCALRAGGIIGPYFFKNDEGHNVTVNGDRYRAMITNFFIPELNNHDVQELWFQQDDATCHTARATIDLLKDTFGDRLISRFGPVNWLPRSCDLTPLDYFLWGYVKSLVYADKLQTLDHLEDNIRRVIADIRPQMLEKVIENWTSRLDYIRASRGSPMPEIIFKMFVANNPRECLLTSRYQATRGGRGSRVVKVSYRIVAGLVTSSSPVPPKIRRIAERCTLNLSRAQTSSRWCDVVARRRFPCRNCGGGDRGGVAIYRPFGKFRRTKSYCHMYGAQGQTTGVPLAPCHDEFRGPRSDYVRQLCNAFAVWSFSKKPLNWKSSCEVGGRGREVGGLQNWGDSGSLVVKVTDSWLVCHEFEPSTTEDPLCRDRCTLHLSRAQTPPVGVA